jgi:hypothetical protein
MRYILVFLTLISSFVTASTIRVENSTITKEMVPVSYFNVEGATYKFTNTIAPHSRGVIEFNMSNVKKDASRFPVVFKYLIAYEMIPMTIDILTIEIYACNSPGCADSVYWKATLRDGSKVKIAQADGNKGREMSLHALSKSNVLTIKDIY